MVPSYQSLTKAVPPLVFYDPSTTKEISLTNPCRATPTQGGFSNCPLIAALASLVWVNRNVITNPVNTSPVRDSDGNITGYSFTFWDYGQNNPMTPNSQQGSRVSLDGLLNPVDDNNIIIPGKKINVIVGYEVLLDNNYQFTDSNGIFYGAGSFLAYEAWQALFERAYAKFCYYENNLPLPSTGEYLTCQDGAIAGSDPGYADVQMLGDDPMDSQGNFWGGNAGIGLVYLTGCNCFQMSTARDYFSLPAQFSTLPGTSSSSSLYAFIKTAFCGETRKPYPYGTYKTRYPLVAWTYASGSQFNGSAIMSNHCYSILGVADKGSSSNNKNQIVLRDITKITNAKSAQSSVFPSNTSCSWAYYEGRFRMGTIAQYPPSSSSRFPQSPIALPAPNGLFSLDEDQFRTCFQAIGWAEGY